MKKKDLIDNTVKLQSKYADLIWYARTSSDNYHIKGVVENVKRIETEYPNEVKALWDDESNWQHGFHSGMVAALRYVLTLDEGGLEQAEQEFPMLDS